MQRLYFISPNQDITVKIAQELEALGLTKDEVHVLGRDWKGLEQRGVNSATLINTSDVANAAVRGLKFGVPLGVVIGIVAFFVLGFDSVLSFLGLVVGLAIFGGLFGIWTSTMIGVSVRDVKINKYKRAIDKEDAYLMLVDVPENQEHEIDAAIRRHHPEVAIEKASVREKQQQGAGV
ncbi:magnesium transporter [Litchfieldella xinjiangensis]|uniref:magnesium transporter n=1 Tax=Litchfieldella xinjiangensis TaxID=1166948 RepID=UPI0005BE4BB6|nr:magnesium transporter [Halomonas xinjiangensis]